MRGTGFIFSDEVVYYTDNYIFYMILSYPSYTTHLGSREYIHQQISGLESFFSSTLSLNSLQANTKYMETRTMFNRNNENAKLSCLSLLASSVLVLGGIAFVAPANAVQFNNGETAFNSPPTLVDSDLNSFTADVSTTYYFTVKVPENAGEPLKALQIKQADNVETIEFVASESRAYFGGGRTSASTIPLSSIGGETPPRGESTVVFAEPIAPGKTVTIALRAKSNPSNGGSGVYLFGVTAFPEGQTSRGQFLGFGRLHFYNQ